MQSHCKPALLALTLVSLCIGQPGLSASPDVVQDQHSQSELIQPALDAEKTTVIRELMEITGATANASQFSNAFTQQMVSVLKSANPQISERAIQIVQEEVSTIVAEELEKETLQEQIYPLYARYFTLDELKGLVAFNRSAVGRQANAVMPALLEESMQAGRRWSRELAPVMSERIQKRFAEEGISIQN